MRQEGNNLYCDRIKPAADRVFSLLLIVLLSPFLLLICAAIVLDDPGPVLFTQKRVGKDKSFFRLHKFRSMKRKTPHDIPTHQLKNPEQYITRVGKFLRKYSLDELPQLFDIFAGKMSFVGPRPALWNQDDLVAERDRYGANAALPGLTGWAQINGRDELEIPVKAKLDGEYTAVLAQGGFPAFRMDVKCFFRTFRSVADAEGVVEGGTGSLHRKEEARKASPEKADGAEARGATRMQQAIASQKKRVLVTGADSYIGESFRRYAEREYADRFEIDTIDMRDARWEESSFAGYDAVFHVAGIAHADSGRISEEKKKLYYDVNTTLAVKTAAKARQEGVKQFLLMSSAIIYGDAPAYGKIKVITGETPPAPANHYGNSKWQADKRVRALQTEAFRVAVIRAPMIYGPGCKGNYPLLAKLAGKLPFFPAVENRRSMLYIENLCAFVCLLIAQGEGGIFFPQNAEYTKTAQMVRLIGDARGRRVRCTKLLNPAVRLVSFLPGTPGRLVKKAFGSIVYDRELSEYAGGAYRVAGLRESIFETERARDE
ncbi:MAG: sugar transferase [Lachnospiraceae bacterium]|nr:sugar transferase [Lachnospiraceae bacterium]